MEKLLTIPRKRAELKYLKRHFFQACNFCDLLSCYSDDHLNQYQFFIDKQGQSKTFIAVSPNNNSWNIYGQPSQHSTEYLNFLYSMLGYPNMIFGPVELQNFFPNDLQEKVHAQNPYLFMHIDQKKIQHSMPNHGYMDKAKTKDYPLIKTWLETFNLEQNSSWTVPKLSDINKNQYYLLFNHQNQFIGACGNTIVSPNRFWMGRLFIFQKHRRHGWGTLFTQMLLLQAKKEGKDMALQVNTSNKPAIALYKKFQFSVVGENCFWKLS
ncbi:GNAT family N-acetyltransferase [bacterium]|nr:GNAT family N-acetyltransferase [bacterium]